MPPLPYQPASWSKEVDDWDFTSTVQSSLGGLKDMGTKLMEPVGQQLASLMPQQPMPEPQPFQPMEIPEVRPFRLPDINAWGMQEPEPQQQQSAPTFDMGPSTGATTATVRRPSAQSGSFALPGPEAWGMEPAAPARAVAGRPAARGGAAAAPAGEIDNSSRQAFVRTAYPHMLQAADGDHQLAEWMLAKAISENGDVGEGGGFIGNNFSGIKGTGSAGSFTADTWEMENGVRVPRRAQFAAYATPQEGFRAFGEFLRTNPRYGPALQTYQQTKDPRQLFQQINAAGYATNPTWWKDIESIRAGQVAPVTKDLRAAPPSQSQGAPVGTAAGGAGIRVVPDATPNSYWTSGGTHGGAPAADIFAPLGAPILAPVSGTSRPAVYPSGGNATIIAGDDGKYYYMAHGHVPFVGGRIEAGQAIGQVGQSGNARGTSPHLHYAIATNPGIFDAKNGSGDITGEAYWKTPDGRVHSVSDGHSHGPAAPPGGPPAADTRRPQPTSARPQPSPALPPAPAPSPVPAPPPETAPFQDTQMEAAPSIHANVARAFEAANGRPPTPEEARELAALGFG